MDESTMPPTVSIVTATYNYGQYLPQALDSILAQTFTDWESIIVDDGSTDNTREVVRPYLSDPRFLYVRTENRGQPAAKNLGIREARGGLVAFLDGDDAWLPEKLHRQVAVFHATPHVGVVYTRRHTIDPMGDRILTCDDRPQRGNVLQSMFKDNFVCFSSSMVRLAVLEEVGLFNESIPLAIDYDLWLRIAARYLFDYVDEPLVLYRTGHANLSQRSHERLHVALMIMDRFLDEHDGRALLPQRVIRRAYAETYAHIGEAVAQYSRLRSSPWFVQALARDSLNNEVWRSLIHSHAPQWSRRLLHAARRAFAML